MCTVLLYEMAQNDQADVATTSQQATRNVFLYASVFVFCFIGLFVLKVEEPDAKVACLLCHMAPVCCPLLTRSLLVGSSLSAGRLLTLCW